MTTSKSVVFFGTEHFSVPSLEALIAADYSIKYVVTKPDAPRGRGQKLQPPEVKELATKHGIPVLQPTRLSEIIPALSSLDEPLGVLVSYGKIIPQSIIELFSPGIINVHPSLLPKYRGPSPIEAAIKNGDEATGISIMQLINEMDAGPVYAQLPLPLVGTETKPQLYEDYAARGARLLAETLPGILDGSLRPVEQNHEQASYCSLLKKEDGVMDAENKTALQLEREVRAFLGYPKSRLTLGGHEVIVLSAHVSPTSDEAPLIVTCKDNSYLSIDEVIAPSGKKMNAEAFIRGYTVK